MASPYSDLSRPPLRPEPLRRALVVPGGLWTDIRVVAETGSTNADVADAARAGAAEGLIVVAERQTSGRGRLDRRWEAPARSGLTVSVLLRPPVPAARLGWLPLLAGVAVAEAVGHIAVVDAVVKWPNDLLVRSAVGSSSEKAVGSSSGKAVGGSSSGKAVGGSSYGKCAGILAEAADGAVVLGVGLNVSQAEDELPPPADPDAYPPTSLALVGAASTDRDPLLRALLRAVEGWYDRWRAADGDPDACGLRAAYRERCATLGEDVRVLLPAGASVTGRAVDIDADGRLLVVSTDGQRALAAGDVLRVR